MSCKGDLGQVGVQGGPWAPAQAVRTLDRAGLVWGECGGPGLPRHWKELGRGKGWRWWSAAGPNSRLAGSSWTCGAAPRPRARDRHLIGKGSLQTWLSDGPPDKGWSWGPDCCSRLCKKGSGLGQKTHTQRLSGHRAEAGDADTSPGSPGPPEPERQEGSCPRSLGAPLQAVSPNCGLRTGRRHVFRCELPGLGPLVTGDTDALSLRPWGLGGLLSVEAQIRTLSPQGQSRSQPGSVNSTGLRGDLNPGCRQEGPWVLAALGGGGAWNMRGTPRLAADVLHAGTPGRFSRQALYRGDDEAGL